MEIVYKLAILILLGVITLYLFKRYFKESFKEGFAEGNNVGLNSTDIANAAIKAIDTPVSEPEKIEEIPKCKPGDWWENQPIKAIRSKLWGASYNLIYDENGSVNTPVLIPIINPNSQAPPGCLTVNKTGWHESAMCANKNIDQQWLVVQITNQDDFESAIKKAKDSNGTIGFTYGYKMDKVDYPFFIVISKEYPSQALYYNGSALGVRPIGNYDDLKWDILSAEVKEPIKTNNFNFYTKLTPEFRYDSLPEQSSLSFENIAGAQDLAGNQQALTALLAQVLKQPTTNPAFGVSGGLKVNVEMTDDIINKLTGSTNSGNNVSNTAAINTTIEKFSSNLSYYPNKPFDIPVTLEYSMASVNNNSTNNNSNGNTEVVPINEIDENGNMFQVGETIMTKKDNSNKTCNDTLCHPNMDEWLKKPFPCSGCVPNEAETWN